MLDKVTITGADDGTSVAELEALSAEFPFVEWAILVSASHRGPSPRWPSEAWRENFSIAVAKTGMKASCHVCGKWVLDIMAGEAQILFFSGSMPGLLMSACQRIQFNFHGVKHRVRADEGAGPAFLRSIDLITFESQGVGVKQFIFQADGVNDEICRKALAAGVDAVPLFDCSHGAGVVPGEWPGPAFLDKDDKPVYHGYADGLGPGTLEEQLPRIFAAAGAARIWVDMETRVRTPDDERLDMAKVRRCLEICAPHVSKEA